MGVLATQKMDSQDAVHHADLEMKVAMASPRDGNSQGDLPSPGKLKKATSSSASSMQRKLVDMLSPLLVGSARREHATTASKPATPTTPTLPMESPRAPHHAAAASPTAPSSPSLSRALSHNSSATLDSMSDGSRSKKTSIESNASSGSSTATAAAHHHHHHAAAPAPAPAAAPAGPALLTPHLDRLLNAARYCRLPPSPRAEPPPGAPAGTPNQTIPLAMSHTLPPRMVRPHWCVDDYTILEKLYTGYASTVFKAQCKRSGETVVLKIYTLAAVCDLYKYQIYREVRVHASLQHENIVHLYAAFQEGDRVIMVQEYADGSDLFTLLHKYGGRLSERLAVQVVLDPFLRVLHYLHTRAIIHRDIKPENILFTKNMVLKLGDFGLAIDLREERAVTRAGTLDYMAPEVLRCPFKSRPEENKDNERLHYGARVDAWAVGVLTYELLVGFPPFFDQSRTGTEERIVTKSPDYPSTLSEEAKAYISRALHKNPAERPTILEMLHHPWVDQYRARRSMRNIPSAPVTASPGSSSSSSAAAAQAAAAAAAQQAAKARAVATQTNIITAQAAVQAAMASQAPHGMHHAPAAAAYPAPMHTILSSITQAEPVAAPAKQEQQHVPTATVQRQPSDDASVYMNVGTVANPKAAAAPGVQVMARAGPVAAPPPGITHSLPTTAM